MTSKVVYCYSPEYSQICARYEREEMRAALVHSLIEAYQLFNGMQLICGVPATNRDLLSFHSSDYISALKTESSCPGTLSDDDLETYGLTLDCMALPGVYDYACLVTGCTLECVKRIVDGSCKVAINWGGGWHHASRFSASGFCYVNDCVIGILELKKTFDRILYLDLDIHHGDGVEDAFSCTNSVVTLSFHLLQEGFFPGTGSLNSSGTGRGRHSSLNFPLLPGASDTTVISAFDSVVPLVLEKFNPQVVVVEFGADGLSFDPLGGFNLTSHFYIYAAKYLKNINVPLLILGGGGYNRVNVAKCWTAVTAEFINQHLPIDIPEHQYFLDYKPDYVITTMPSNIPDQNTNEYIKTTADTLKNYIYSISSEC